MLSVRLVLFLFTFSMLGRPCMWACGMLGVSAAVRLTELAGFFKFVTFAGDKGRGRKNQEQVESFHRAP